MQPRLVSSRATRGGGPWQVMGPEARAACPQHRSVCMELLELLSHPQLLLLVAAPTPHVPAWVTACLPHVPEAPC